MNNPYEHISKVIESLIAGEKNLVANLANTAAVLKEELEPLWVGFYLVDKHSNQLILGPFQGPLACTRIGFGKGVCGTVWKNKKAELVDDVHQFPGHIACSSQTNSEIVVPIIKNDEVLAILDIDSTEFSKFSNEDLIGLSRICRSLVSIF
jgi:L-methionine (R)-S-oxide reductase